MLFDRNAAESPQAQAARRACRILVVDDDKIARAAISALLEVFGYQVEVAATGNEALRVLRATPCDIVVTDWQMPDMDGLALCRRLRLMAHDAYVYVVMLSVRSAELDILIGLGAGADDYVIKGTSLDELMARIETGRRITSAAHRARSSNTGPNSGAHDLNYLLEHLPREIARAQRHEHALAVLSCHADVLDAAATQGDPASGDGWTRYFLERSAASLRASDWCARTGPNDFMIILPETTAKYAHHVAAKLHRSFTPLQPPAPMVPIEFTVTIEVTAVAAAYDAQSYSRMYAMLRAIRERKYVPGIVFAVAPKSEMINRDNVFYVSARNKDEIN